MSDLAQTCKHLQSKWNELLKADEAEPASIGGGLYRLAYRGDGHDLFTRYSINREFNHAHECDSFILGIAALLDSENYSLLSSSISHTDRKFIENELAQYNKNSKDRKHMQALGYTDTMQVWCVYIPRV